MTYHSLVTSLPDTINGAFECSGALAALANVRRLLRDRIVKGVVWQTQVFWVSWGLWNLFYYPHLGQWASFMGGALVVCANLLWVILALRYDSERNLYIPNLDLDRHSDIRDAVASGRMSRRAARREVMRRDVDIITVRERLLAEVSAGKMSINDARRELNRIESIDSESINPFYGQPSEVIYNEKRIKGRLYVDYLTARVLITHPTILCNESQLIREGKAPNEMCYTLHGPDRKAVWRADMRRPLCASCMIERLYC